MPDGARPSSDSAIPGLVVAGGMLTGVSAVILSIVALLGGQEVGAGLFMLAAAVVFGALANAVFRR